MNYDFTGFDEKRPEDVEDISKNYEGYSSMELGDFYYDTMSSNKKTRKKLKKISKKTSKQKKKFHKTIKAMQEQIDSLAKGLKKIDSSLYNSKLNALISCDDAIERKRIVAEILRQEDIR